VAPIVLILVLIALILPGCDDPDPESYTFGTTEYWNVPPDERVFPEPRSITIGPSDEVIVTDKNARVLVFDAKGDLLRWWRMPEFKNGNPQNACVLADGRIAVADTHYFRVLFFDQEGHVVGEFGQPGDGPGCFNFPICVVQDDEGDLYVGEFGGKDRVQKFTAHGQFLKRFGEVGAEPGQFQRMAGMAWRRGPDGIGRLYIADAENGRIQIFTDDGEFDGLLGASTHTQTFTDEPYHRFNMPYDVEVDARGRIYVVEWGAGRISMFEPDGRLVGRYGSPGLGKDQFHTPWSIGVDSQGRIRVADTGNRRIVAINP